ncbi:DNA-binding MarR family transcriptional regulator [Tamaricihabitans halophyticus]|uniref:DNA-binding MarR family transcriptional regulator n=1 Tax=Tamaricihabitans halophyticus TaxID=1262583 RepID=A0A4R2R1Z4_9PSEU|nr:MarR family winged helix-turn-helix transcriptional regulator [Tamaricihabitans halophyticus]TCP56533.1 DNA-binding MarR family transcriptional regulator [Tamaricihabitans halophyticus]
MADGVDAIQEGWRRERPDFPVESIGVITRIWRLAQWFSDDRRRTLRALDTDPSTLDLLSTLRRSGEPYAMTPAELAEASLISAGAISQRVAKAERAGWVHTERGASGKRTSRVRLTEAGLWLNEQLVGDLLAHEQTLVEHLSPGERAQLTELLRKLLAGLG